MFYSNRIRTYQNRIDATRAAAAGTTEGDGLRVCGSSEGVPALGFAHRKREGGKARRSTPMNDEGGGVRAEH